MKKIVVRIGFIVSLALLTTACQNTASGHSYKNPATVQEGIQIVTTPFSSRSYTPITLQVGVPVKWTIQMNAKDLNNCNNEILIPKYNIEQKLTAGETIIEFTPDETGTIPYSCWMGMIRSHITVVDHLDENGP